VAKAATARKRPPKRETPGREGLRVRRFDADRKDQVLDLDEALSARPTERQLVWIDIGGEPEPGEIERVAEAFELDPHTRRLLEHPERLPHLAIHGGYLHVGVGAEPNDERPGETPWLDVIGGENVVITRHEAPISFLDDMDDRIELDTSFGLLDAGTFVSSLLDAAVTSYFRAVDAIEDDVDRLDAKSLRDDGRHQLLDDLVALRRRIARLRRVLTDHRQVFATLGGAEIAQVTDNPDSAPAFQAVAARFENALGAVEDARDVLLGSFEVYMTRTAQRTNDVMKVLALATVLLLPGSLAAGLLGMNVTVPLSKDDPLSFWMVVAGVVLFAVFILVVARLRRWL
jgi:Mg2+ and Co2+ transporter CorA